MRDNYNGHAGVDIREPKPTQPGYLMLKRLSKSLEKGVDRYLMEKNAIILDIGCGKKPYQPFFVQKSTLYVGADIKHGEYVDVLCDGEKLPFKDSCFQAISCTQVIEHVEEPRALIDETIRVLECDGLLFISTHGSWPVHGSPNDYWRWTEHGLKKLLFHYRIHEIHKCGGSATSIIELLELLIPNRSLGVVIIFLLNKLGDFLDDLSWFNAKLPDLATTYLAIARKIR